MVSRAAAQTKPISARTFEANEREWGTLSHLIGRIYECAIDPGQWDDTLTELASLLAPPEWDVVMLLWEKLNAPGGRFVGATNLVPMAREVYLATFAGRQPWSRRIAALPIGRVVDTDEIMPRSELIESDFYKNFLSAWGMQIAVGVLLDRRGPDRLGFIMPGHTGHDLEGLKRGLRLLAPHLQRAARISRALGEANLRADAAESALDRAPNAIATLTPQLEILNANAKLHGLAESGWIKLNGRAFTFTDRNAQAKLLALAAMAAPASTSFKASGPGGAELAVLGARLTTQIADTLTGRIEGAGLIVSIGIGARAPLIEINRLAAWFGLTPSEARLAARLTAGDTLAVYAAHRGVSMNAVRFLLKGIYRKIGVKSQAELIGRIRDLP